MTMTLANARYLSLATFRRNGAAVATPVWFAESSAGYYVFSAPDAGKVKRLRNSPRTQVAPCDFRGELLGDWQEARAYLVDNATEQRAAHGLLLRKYGWRMKLLDLVSTLGRRIDARQYIRIEMPNAGAGG